MSCGCHGSSRIFAEQVYAQEQCLFCAMKHLTVAWTLFNEFGYEDMNLASIDGNLRLCISHMQYTDKAFCLQVRNLAVAVEKRNFDEATNEVFEDLIKQLQAKIYVEFPDMKQKLDDILKK